MPVYRHPFCNDLRFGYYAWCLHCERVSKTRDWIRNNWSCPYLNCKGGVFDAFPWHVYYWPKSENPEYPSIPKLKKRYPLYLRKSRLVSDSAGGKGTSKDGGLSFIRF